MPNPNPIFERMKSVAECLCATIVTENLPDVCFCGILPGAGVPADYSGSCGQKCGQAWVRLVTAFPATAIAEPSLRTGNCNLGIGYELELGILRCAPSSTVTGRPPSAEQLLASTELQVADMYAMMKAVQCCGIGDKDYIMGGYEPAGPDGGLVGGTLNFSFAT